MTERTSRPRACLFAIGGGVVGSAGGAAAEVDASAEASFGAVLLDPFVTGRATGADGGGDTISKPPSSSSSSSSDLTSMISGSSLIDTLVASERRASVGEESNGSSSSDVASLAVLLAGRSTAAISDIDVCA